MPPRATGQLEFKDGRYRVRLRFACGARPWKVLPPGLSAVQANALALELAEKAKKSDYIGGRKRTIRKVSDGEKVSTWFYRWTAVRARDGILSTVDDESRFRNHIEESLGDMAMVDVTADDTELLREDIERKVVDGKLAWKTALNIWALVTSMFRDACRGRHKELRVRKDNPTADILPPVKGRKKTKAYLYPTEVTKVLRCEALPLNWRVIVALSVYTYMRSGELEALEWANIDFEHGIIHITQSTQTDGSIGSPKGDRSRKIPIEPALMRLLKEGKLAAGHNGLVIHVPQKKARAGQLRDMLRRAGVTRSDLFARDATRTPITFHDLRATGITWMAVRGDDPLKIMQRAGHRSFVTTQEYIREAESVGADFGEVFPALPCELRATPFGHLVRAKSDRRVS